MLKNKNLLVAALLTAVASTSAIAGDRSSYDTYQYETGYNPDYAYNVATSAFTSEKEVVTYGPTYGDRAGSFTVEYDRVNAELQCKSCGVDGDIKVTTNVAIRDLKAYGLRDRAYSLQEGKKSTTIINQADNGENLAISLQQSGTWDNTTEITQKNNGSLETQAIVNIGSGGNHIAEIEQSESNGAVASIVIDSRNRSASRNQAYIEQENVDRSVANIEIDGFDNKAKIEQENTDRSMAAIRLIGRDNDVNIDQETAATWGNTEGNIAVVDFRGNANKIDVEQVGSNNIGYIESIGSTDVSYSDVQLTQVGDNNQGYVLIGGNYNNVKATQEGSYDYFCSTQTGSGNTFVLNQTGR